MCGGWGYAVARNNLTRWCKKNGTDKTFFQIYSLFLQYYYDETDMCTLPDGENGQTRTTSDKNA